MTTLPDACAQEILDVIPAVMRTIRAELRRHRAADLSIPQFRTLAFIDRNVDDSLSDVTAHIGLTLPSMSKIVDGFVTRKLITRQYPSHRSPSHDAGPDSARPDDTAVATRRHARLPG